MSRDEDISSLLELWDLEERELNGEALISVSGRGQRSSLLQGALNLSCVSELPSGTLDGKRTRTGGKICGTCACSNDRQTIWCTECGTAVIGPCTNTSETHYRTIQLSTQQFTSKPNNLRTVSQRQGHSLTANASKRTASSKHSPGKYSDPPQTKRCWETSGVYMWRKPSSVKSLGLSPCSKSTITKHTHGVIESRFQPNSRNSVTLQSSTVSTKWLEILIHHSCKFS